MKQFFTTLIAIFLFSVSGFSQDENAYFFSKIVESSFEETLQNTKAALKEYGFGIITEIEMDKTLKEKLNNVEMKRYQILGACNPKYAYETLQVEENIGLFLPCKVLVKEIDENQTEVVMVNPTELMRMLGNEDLLNVAETVTERFERALREIE
jgi:uncharacterized protein (DUF302 family)